LNKLIPLLAFSILLLVPLGSQNAFAGISQICNTAQTPLVDLLAGECIIAGDKQFDNWVLVEPTFEYDLSNAQVIPVNDDPNNPGLRFLTPGLTDPSVGFEIFSIGYDVTSLSDDLIKDFSLELIDVSGDVSMDEFLEPCCANQAFVANPGFLFDELEFAPVQSIRVLIVPLLGVGAGSASLDEFVALYSQLPAEVVGGEIIPIDATSLILAGAQTPALWIISAFSALGIGAFWFTRNPYNVRNIKVIFQDYLNRF